jgi:hypothetical protein
VGAYDTYAAAQQAVDRLAEHDFPVQDVVIVGTGLRWEERVRGRLDPAATAGLGALGGLLLAMPAWAAATLGRQFVLAALSALLGAVWGLLAHVVLTGGGHRFTSAARVVADRYELFVEHRHAGRAHELLHPDLPRGRPVPSQWRIG